MQFLDDQIAIHLDALKEVKDELRAGMFYSECPACRGHVKSTCGRCDGHGFIPVARASQLSKDELEFLGVGK